VLIQKPKLPTAPKLIVETIPVTLMTLLTDSVPFCMTVPCIEAALVPPCHNLT